MTDSSKCVFNVCVRMFCFVSVHGIDFVDLSWERKRFTHENSFDMCPCTVCTDDSLIVLGWPCKVGSWTHSEVALCIQLQFNWP